MAMVKVWNDNIFDYKEKFRDEKIEIKARGFVMMEEDQAHQFKCNFSSAVLDADGNKIPEGFKMIRIEKVGAPTVPELTDTAIKCNACGYVAQNEADLGEHSLESHSHLMVKDELAESAMKDKRPRR